MGKFSAARKLACAFVLALDETVTHLKGNPKEAKQKLAMMCPLSRTVGEKRSQMVCVVFNLSSLSSSFCIHLTVIVSNIV